VSNKKNFQDIEFAIQLIEEWKEMKKSQIQMCESKLCDVEDNLQREDNELLKESFKSDLNLLQYMLKKAIVDLEKLEKIQKKVDDLIV
jgi:hypothetical protein